MEFLPQFLFPVTLDGGEMSCVVFHQIPGVRGQLVLNLIEKTRPIDLMDQ